MKFDTDNPIVKLCAQGMSLEGEGKNDKALKLFMQAWAESTNNFERFTSAHYVARHQKNVASKLTWDQLALDFAIKTNDETLKAAYPSLYLNVAKCFEDLGDFTNAKMNYEEALSFSDHLPDDGYGKLIKGGILNGIERIKQRAFAL